MGENKDQSVLNSLASREQSDDAVWLTTYGDTMSLILVFFIMLFALSTIDATKFKVVALSLSSAFGGKTAIGDKDLGGFSIISDKSAGGDTSPVMAELAKLDSELESFSKLVGDIQKLIEAEKMQGGVEVGLDHRGVVLYAAGSAFFRSAEIEILDEAKPFLQKTMTLLQGINNKILVEGHTDDVPIRNSKFASNWELSTGRATNVVRYFIENAGVSPERLSAAGYAEFKPRYPHSPENRAKNRRVEIIILRAK